MFQFSRVIFVFLIFSVGGCVNKLMQPPPPEFKVWYAAGVDEDGVKKAMLSCGYPNIGGFSGVESTVEEHASAEQCMFRNGFKYKDNWKGVCSLRDYADTLLACKK